MPKAISKFVCQQCGYESTGWLGKCPNCGTWGSLVETREEVLKNPRTPNASKRAIPVRLGDIQPAGLTRISTGFAEFDRVLGGGIVPGSVLLLAGEPGIGKSTLLLQTAVSLKLPKSPKLLNVLYVSGEESPGQIKIRAERLGIKSDNIVFLPETNVDGIIEALSLPSDPSIPSNPSLIIIDSIQALWTSDLTGTAGSVGQVRECAARLLNFAKTQSIPMFFVGHVTKEGAIAGPMVLAHLVDTVLFFEGERFQTLRILRGIKNRFGPTDEMGVFSMEEKGLVGVENPSALFLTGRKEKVPGSVVTCVIEGSRPLLVEVQALVVPSNLPVPRRTASGIDFNRLALLVAVLTRRANLPLSGFDVFVNVAGGIKVAEPAADLAICLAIASAFKDLPVDPGVCLVGEVGLLGEVRNVGQIKKRIQEAKRLGFTRVLTPEEIGTIREAIQLLLKK